ncbi:hypothetical protein [Mycoplasmopsis pullorum]|uniref:Uncharacterized protein n=1 Tax=Mycoplasmopsis pullorum TaxID=48003 RepID=A0A1L4FSW5_9BACT|nr:hypothetical protein [Mycoplasmopsis pullorum]APJ38700.1 hypothetical protein BLA55_03505 [Mycoplasmopsis pullorum]
MKFEKQKAINLLDSWFDDSRVKKLTKKIVNSTTKFANWKSVRLFDAALTYFDYINVNLLKKRIKSLEQLFELMGEDISDMVDGLVNIYDDDLARDEARKITYFSKYHDEEFERLSSKYKNNTYKLLSSAEFYIISDFLERFNQEFEYEFTKEFKHLKG